MSFTPAEMAKLVVFMERKFKCKGIALKKREKAGDSVEVMIDGEYIGLIYKDEEDGEISYDFNMAILDIDLNET
jgi:hypothetical protein